MYESQNIIINLLNVLLLVCEEVFSFVISKKTNERWI